MHFSKAADTKKLQVLKSEEFFLIVQQSFLLLFQSTFHAFTLILTQKEIKLEEEMILGDKKWILTKSNEKLHNMYFLRQNWLTLMYWRDRNSIVLGMFYKY